MALVTYLLGSCVGGPAILVDFDSSSLPAVNGNYYLTFTGGTTPGCYDIIDNAEPSTGIDKVLTMSTDYGDCITCLAVVTPTPTPTNTETPTNTPTPSVTPTQTQTGTANVTPTPTNTETPTNTPTQTNTPSNTATQTSTPTNTPTISVTPSNTPNVCKTYELNGGTDGTTFVGKNCDGFTFNIPVPPYSTTIVCAKEVFVIQGNGYYISIGSCPLPTPTNTSTPTNTPTNTATNTSTPTNTATNTATPTPTNTTTNTPTVTPTNTVTPTVTPTNTGTAAVTPTQTGTAAVTPTQTKTPTPTGTASVTPTPTPTQTGTASVTPTPTPTQYPFSGIGVNSQYEYTVGILGNFSGGSINEGGPANGIAPHPIYTDAYGVPYAQLNAITLGGVNGLNN